MHVATRWLGIGSIALLALGAAAVTSRDTGEPAARETLIEIGRCADSASPRIARMNQEFDVCVAKNLYEVMSIHRDDEGRVVVRAAWDSWFHVCAGISLCSIQQDPDEVDWRGWRAFDLADHPNWSDGWIIAVAAGGDGGARMTFGHDGQLERIETQIGTELDAHVARTILRDDERGADLASDSSRLQESR